MTSSSSPSSVTSSCRESTSTVGGPVRDSLGSSDRQWLDVPSGGRHRVPPTLLATDVSKQLVQRKIVVRVSRRQYIGGAPDATEENTFDRDELSLGDAWQKVDEGASA